MPRRQSYPPTTGPRRHKLYTTLSDEELLKVQKRAASYGRSVMDMDRLLLLGHDHLLVSVERSDGAQEAVES